MNKKTQIVETLENIMYALTSIVYYDGHNEWLKNMRDDMERFINTHDEYASYPCPFNYAEWHTERHVIYMLLVGIFGDWGTSIRSGWIEDIKGCIAFIDSICEKPCDDKEENAK